jgi:hypothetical protein
LDIIDRREIKSLGAETFWPYIGESEVPLEEPGHLSPVTVAKLIELGVTMVGMWIESLYGHPEFFSGPDFPSSVIDALSAETSRGLRLVGNSRVISPRLSFGVQVLSYHLQKRVEEA